MPDRHTDISGVSTSTGFTIGGIPVTLGLSMALWKEASALILVDMGSSVHIFANISLRLIVAFNQGPCMLY